MSWWKEIKIRDLFPLKIECQAVFDHPQKALFVNTIAGSMPAREACIQLPGCQYIVSMLNCQGNIL